MKLFSASKAIVKEKLDQSNTDIAMHNTSIILPLCWILYFLMIKTPHSAVLVYNLMGSPASRVYVGRSKVLISFVRKIFRS